MSRIDGASEASIAGCIDLPHTWPAAGARFSPDRAYRYALWRQWGAGPWLLVIGLNPSTADEARDDPTIRRCAGFARSWRFGGLVVANLFAFRATSPRELIRADLQSGEDNLATVRVLARAVAERGGAVLAAWGAHGSHPGQSTALAAMLEEDGIGVACLGRTRSGEPKHPLYLPGDARPEPYLLDGGALCGGGRLPRCRVPRASA